MSRLVTILSILLLMPVTAVAQEPPIRMPFADVARLVRRIPVADVVRKDLPGYCFDTLTRHAEQMIADSVQRLDRSADPAPIYAVIRQRPCRPPEDPVPPPVRPQPRVTHPQPRVSDQQAVSPRVDTEDRPTLRYPFRQYVTPDDRCAVNRPPANPSDLRIPRRVESVYAYLQTHGPVEDAQSERLVVAMPVAEFVKCFEAFRELARTNNMRLIITATDARDRGWYQRDIIFRGRSLQKADYKSPDEERIFPGAEVPLNP
jgi:hypothetical protein